MESLMTYMAAFGLAAGAGAKAAIPVLALGAFSYTPYFELTERFAWIADPLVMAILGVLVVIEIVVDSHPDLGRFSDFASYLPKVVAGFIGSPPMNFMAGTLDKDPVRFVHPAFSLTLPPGLEDRLAPALGGPVTLGFRPENIMLDDFGG